jgi:hypothetical protein
MLPLFGIPAESIFFLFFRPDLTELFALYHKFKIISESDDQKIYAAEIKSILERTLEAKIS